MKQKVAVRAIINRGDHLLLLKRSGGRPSIEAKYELPGGSVLYGEQPDDAVARYVQEETTLEVRTTKLSDVFTYLDPDDKNTQYTLILYMVELERPQSRIKLSGKYNKYVWYTKTKSPQTTLTESTKLLLGIIQNYDLASSDKKTIAHNKDMLQADAYVVYTDGGSRGNPGPSSAGYVIMNRENEVVDQGGIYLGITTNNQAEYHGVMVGLEKALALGARKVDIRVDSLLVVNQMNGIYKIKNRELWPIHRKIQKLIKKFDKVIFSHIKREFNQVADSMVNKVLDAHKSEKEAESPPRL